MDSFYLESELQNLGLKHFGKNLKISRKASIYSSEDIVIGDNVRIDDFCILSGKITIGNNIHISAYTALYGGDIGIELEDFVTVSSRCAIYAVSDDYSGDYMTNPMIDEKYRNVIEKKIIIKKHGIVASGSLILPGAIIEEGTAIGAMSMVNFKTEPWMIYVGVPCKILKNRSKKILELEKALLKKNCEEA